MKKLVFSLFAALAVSAVAVAADDTPIQVSQLPEAAQRFVQNNFSDMQVAYVERDNGLVRSYEVVFVNGGKIEFDSDGDWTEVDVKQASVPEQIVPEQIREFVRANYPGQIIHAIERDGRTWEIGLSNGLDLKFDRKFRLIDIDD